MRVVSIGDLVTDYYYKNYKLVGLNGGMTSHNIVVNLSKCGIETAVYGVCGNDEAGMLAIKSLKDLNVDVSNVKIIDNIKTRCFHVSYFDKDNKISFVSKKRCPFCNNKNWYDESMIDCDYILNNINSNDILVFDNLNEKNQIIIDKVNNKKIIDLGQYFEFENLNKKDIIKKLKNKFEIINFNERVSEFLLKRLNLSNDLELYECLKPTLMTITRGENGATFIHKDKLYNFALTSKANVVDSTGAGDAFVSSIINDYIKNNLTVDPELFNKWYDNTVKITNKVVQKFGARGHLKSLYKIKKVDNSCTCQKFNLILRKQIKRCSININNLEARLINAIDSKASNKIKNIMFDENGNYLFVGTGGSFAGAKFASIIINNMYGSNTYTLYPRDIVYRNNDKINKVIMFSYSGTTNDLLEGTKEFDNSNKYIVTKGLVQNVVLKTGVSKNNIISYRTGSNKGKERGFLSFEGSVVPAALFLNYYLSDDNNFDLKKFIHSSLIKWNKYFEEEFNKDYIKAMFKQGNLVNIFTGDNTNCASVDTESKIIESGIINCIIHEKKNFSHGRFINYENLNNKHNIYYKQKNSSKYENVLLNYIKNDNNLVIESDYDGILCEFDLLIASQLLIYYVGKLLDIDVSKPNYSDDAMKIYFYKGEL